ncbi:hypothetical protein M406DRAFT_348037 [Cryphonectria parasitica EP155]|uniref:Protein sip5 n=1 Tax=Cryphonectria parasitica (strain ATCC 38755 / EP155) TaxID=660469 RepID=A0A9P4XW28_CRYP1|nr:uncharacterized protein M406DRAFT_348037 [Cryphonectria parasitica EP155]KAF3761877.1 hypothetical protein M406DRAFT_348037 [Cryphonectria parasitica EP155]
MGNTPAKESRSGDPSASSGRHHRSSIAPAFDPSASSSRDNHSSRLRNRSSRNDLGAILGIGSSSNSRGESSHERRETRAEREARRLERERINRIKDRERSLREEHVDGGYLVTMGVYVGTEDFSKQVVRQLQIERKLAPFWRGLNDFSETWAEHQIVAAARGLPIPPADQTPPPELIPRPASQHASPTGSTPNLNNLTVPLGPRTMSAASDRSASNAGSALPSPTFTGPSSKGSPAAFKPRTKALAAALSLGSRNGSSSELTPREINLPNDPFVNGQPLEVFLYKEGAECPICFLYYPPYLNHTRCCDQPICSECFVQIKRPDPHFPDSHDNEGNAADASSPDANVEEAEMLISEPATCPYCQQPELGVTYEPPPFRRGLTYTISPATVGQMGTAMSSNSSLGSTSPSPFVSPPPSASIGRRRTQSLSANAPNVITTDRVRPDWAAKLAAQRNHLARRAAAATALHTAAFLMGDNTGRSFGRMSRFGRRNTGENNANDNGASASASAEPAPSGSEPGGARNTSSRSALVGPRHSHMENLENMMLAEAIRLSLAAEEERKRKADKEERKEAKRKEKEERKAAKAAAKGQPYNGSGHSSASGSTLSLPGLSTIGRRRGNSAASNLRVEATTANAMASSGSSSPPKANNPTSASDKGKAVDRGGPPQVSPESEVGKSNVDAVHPVTAAPTSIPAPPPSSSPRPIPSPLHSAGPSHLRQMSSASSASESGPESQPGSYQNPSNLQFQDPRSSGLSLSGKSDNSDDAGGRPAEDSETEPNYNFNSLAQLVGVELEGVNAGRRLSQIGESHAEEESTADADKRSSLHEGTEHVEDVSTFVDTPQLMVTPGTPMVGDDEAAESKQLGFQGTQTVEVPDDFATQ